jgi:hypothetical protein
LFKVIFTDQIELEELRFKDILYEELGHGLKAKKSQDFNLELSYYIMLFSYVVRIFATKIVVSSNYYI